MFNSIIVAIGLILAVILSAGCGTQGVFALPAVPGPAGAKGDPGVAGATGSDGQDGDNGAVGPTGLQGATGPTGADGVLEVIKLCPNITGNYPEYLLRTQFGLFGVWYGGGHTFLAKIIPGNYVTTDGRNCHFRVTVDLEVINE